MPAYKAYGLTIQSEFPVPELITLARETGVPDIHFSSGKVEVPVKGDAIRDGQALSLGPGRFLYMKKRCGRFLVLEGARIVVDPDPGVEARVWRLSLFGPALALLLIQRGFLVLHGGAVAFPGGSVLLLGPAGAGKSTLTAELCRLGGKLLTDDVVTLDMDHEPPLVLPGVPLLKLWPDAVESAPEGVRTGALHPDFDKVGCRVEDALLSEPAPVARIFMLTKGDKLERRPIRGMTAFQALAAFQFAVRYGDSFVSGLDGREVLAKLTALMNHAPVEVLRRPPNRGLLAETAALIAADL